jgi:hypothetical protein
LASTSSAMHQIRVSNEKSGSMATTCSSLTSAGICSCFARNI